MCTHHQESSLSSPRMSVSVSKQNKDDSSKNYKAHVVAIGYSQVPGVDIWSTSAPVVVVTSVTVRLLLALTFIFYMHIHQLGVPNAFSYARIEGAVCMQPTLAYQVPPGHCCMLKRSLYGLRSSPQSW